MMLLGIYKDTDGEIKSNIYYNWGLWFTDTFSPATEIIDMVLFKISGKTYAERQANLRELATHCQNAISQATGLSYGEFTSIQWFFEKNGKRYGLVKEFKENGII